MTCKDKIIEMHFKNANKMFPNKVIKKMRREDLRKFFLDNDKKMLNKERREFEDEFFGKTSGNEFFVERNRKTIKFTNFDD